MDTKFLSDMFVAGAPVLEKILRAVIIYFFLVAGLRLAGKRELAQLNSIDFIVLLTLSNAVQNAIIGNDNSVTGGIISAVVLLTLNYLVARFFFTHKKIEETVEGKSTILIEDGQIQFLNLKKELITQEELEIAAHKQGFASLREISSARIEPGGAITMVAKKPPVDDIRHNEIIERINALAREMASLRAMIRKR